VTREELREKLWGPTFVDFEEGLNTAVRKLRDALGDSASNPRFIETLPRRGYRFIAPVQADVAATTPVSKPPPNRTRIYVAAGFVTLALATTVWFNRPSRGWTSTPPTQITRDSGLTTDPAISQDGTLVAYASDRSDHSNLDIWLQHLSGGEARRLTDDPGDDSEPDISPDGGQIAFRSERAGGGIYTVPTLGGPLSLIVKNGFVPRFSPDGKQLAYAVGSFGSGAFAGQLRIKNLASGAVVEVADGLMAAGPVGWSPDGKHLAFIGRKDIPDRHDLWICSVDGGPATRLADLPHPPNPHQYVQFGVVRTSAVAWHHDQLILSLKEGDSTNLWTARISPDARRLVESVTRLTLGSGSEVLPAVSNTGRMIFANHSHSVNIWETSLDSNGVAGPIRRLTGDRALNYRPTVSRDGTVMTFISDRGGNFDVWKKDLLTGKESPVTRTLTPEIFGTLSQNGAEVATWDGQIVSVVSMTDGASRPFCEKCGRPDVWTADGRLILSPGNQRGVWIRSPNGKQGTMIATPREFAKTGPDLSHDGRWLTLHTTSTVGRLTSKRQIFVAPFSGGPIPEESWIPVTDGEALDREPKWSVDDTQIFFLSDRDGFRCIFARKLDRATKRPLGELFPVLHLHSPGQSLMLVPNTGNVSIVPVANKLIFSMGELTSNLWLTEMRQRQ